MMTSPEDRIRSLLSVGALAPRTGPDPSCTVDGCSRTLAAEGLCTRHYYRQSRNGDPLVDDKPGVRTPKGSPCFVQEGPRACGRPSVSRGMCGRHYYRQSQYGDPLGGPGRGRRRGVDGVRQPSVNDGPCPVQTPSGVCGRDRVARGMCRPHYYRSKTYGDPLGGPGRKLDAVPRTCSAEDGGDPCQSPARIKGLCSKHHYRVSRHGDASVRLYGRLSPADAEVIRTRYRRYCPENGREALAREFGVSIRTITSAVNGTTHRKD